MGKVHGCEIGVGGAILDAQGGWTWKAPRYGEHFRRCSYCGSIHPQDLVREIGWHAEWADQKYGWPHKFYVTLQPTAKNAELLVSRASTSSPTEHELEPGWVRARDLTNEQLIALHLDGKGSWADLVHEVEADKAGERFHAYRFGTQGQYPIHAKFYTEHLADQSIPATTRARIHRRCGLVFKFLDDGRVRWSPYDYSADS